MARRNKAGQNQNLAFFIPHLGCPNQCSFCDQKIISGTQQPPEPQAIAAVCAETLQRTPDPQHMEIAFFGGSFTAIPQEQMTAYLACVQPYVGTHGFGGIRISTRPDAISEEILDVLKQYHVTAIELGAQSMSDRVLQMNQRGHTAQDVVTAADLIHRAGFSLGLQMMYGLYGSTDSEEIQTLEALIALKPDTMRLYPTVVLAHTRLAELYQQGEYILPSWDEMLDFVAAALCRLKAENIAVIRCGLHAEAGLEQRMLAGFYHPALRELAESRLYLRAMRHFLAHHPEALQIVAKVGLGCAGRAAGHQRCNRNVLWESFGNAERRFHSFLKIVETDEQQDGILRMYGMNRLPDGTWHLTGEEVYDVFKITGITGL